MPRSPTMSRSAEASEASIFTTPAPAPKSRAALSPAARGAAGSGAIAGRAVSGWPASMSRPSVPAEDSVSVVLCNPVRAPASLIPVPGPRMECAAHACARLASRRPPRYRATMNNVQPPSRLLLGPGPSMVNARVYAAMARPLVGHLDPYFLELLERVQGDLRTVFGTANAVTLPISGTGSAGMETCFANLVEDGDEVVIVVSGVFGTRMCDVATRLGARVERVEVEWGRVADPADVEAAIGRCKRPKIVAVVHAETSTGAWQPLREISRLAHEADALLLVDCVTSLAGCPVGIDELAIDAAYSGTQKCLSCPPGLSPVTMSERAMAAVAARKTKPR